MMKTSRILWVVVFLLMGSVGTGLFAQKNLEAVVKKCIEDKSVNKSTVQRKDPKTKALVSVIRTITVQDDLSLKNEIKSAFERDKEDAYQVIENEGGGNTNWFIKFETDKSRVSYSLDLNGDMVSLTVIEKFDRKDESVRVSKGIPSEQE